MTGYLKLLMAASYILAVIFVTRHNPQVRLGNYESPGKAF